MRLGWGIVKRVNDGPRAWTLPDEESPLFVVAWWTVFSLLASTAAGWFIWLGPADGLAVACAVVVLAFASAPTIARGACGLLRLRVGASLRLDEGELTWPNAAGAKVRRVTVDEIGRAHV